MRVNWLFAAMATYGLAACAGTESHIQTLEYFQEYRIDKVDASDHDYKVYLSMRPDLTYDPTIKEQRDSYALLGLKRQCPNGRVVGEETIQRGQFLSGRPMGTYILKVKCDG